MDTRVKIRIRLADVAATIYALIKRETINPLKGNP